MIRVASNLSQQAFSAQLGFSQSNIAEIEKGVKEPSRNIMKALISHYKININWLLTGTGSMYKEDRPPRPAYFAYGEVPETEKDKVRMQRFIGYYWSKADEKERNWLEIQFRKCFPEYLEWIDKHKDEVYNDLCVKEQQAIYGSALNLNEPPAKYDKKKDAE
ncbi:MAG: helix-turn-helix transcriptional regulator [Nitrospirae bacterium]|nr:helix-turn-helix transcriptional regulator [Nitrospirota bacterium]